MHEYSKFRDLDLNGDLDLNRDLRFVLNAG